MWRAANRAQIAALVPDVAPVSFGDQPSLGLRADRAPELDEL
jgi:hypothetical protein